MSYPGSFEQVETLASMMPNAWPLFFRQRNPLPIQLSAMPLIVRGESVLLCGPTASGKTEAAVAPLFQRHYSFHRNRLGVIYVAPTKALVNDLYIRLTDYLGREIAENITRYTGDRHDFKSPEGAFLLLATPEALDSLQLTQPEKLSSVRAVVVDEIHFLHGRARGQQLRYVIERVRRNCTEPCSPKDNFQVIGMSATVSNIEEVARLWMGEQASVVKAGEDRNIEMHLLQLESERDDDSAQRAKQISEWIVKNEPLKVLVFTNSRNRAHKIAVELNRKLTGSRWPVHMHIGVLSKTERERIEHAMKEETHGLCVATSTLELGIDIGEIETVVLAEPPYSINTFLQRIGRGNRRTGKCCVLAPYGDEHEKNIFQALLFCAEKGLLDEVHEYDRPSVRFQQLLSVIWREIRTSHLVTKRMVHEKLGHRDYDDILEDMLYTGALKEVHGELILSDGLMDEADARRMHSVITGSAGGNLVDSLSGETVAHSLDAQTSVGGFYSRGRIKHLEASPSGEFYLREMPYKDGTPLAKLPASRRTGGLSRRLLWSIAEIRGMDPRQWRFDENRLTTWGGGEYNRLIKLVLQKEQAAERISADDEGLSAQRWNMVPSPDLIHVLTERAAHSKLGKSAAGFREPTRYLSRLSPQLQDLEAANSIPLKNFADWLAECHPQVTRDRGT